MSVQGDQLKHTEEDALEPDRPGAEAEVVVLRLFFKGSP